MLSISKSVCVQYDVKRSKFICFLFRVDSIDCVNDYLSDLSSKYSDSTHICYAYIIDGVARFSDDGEPSGTAGMPILNVLLNKKLNHILCCVVRYFGGIKLGAGGLVRAYTNSSVLCINESIFINLIKGKLYSISFDYENTKLIDNIVGSYVFEKSYNEKVVYKIRVIDDGIIDEVSKFSKVDFIGDCYIEKELDF